MPHGLRFTQPRFTLSQGPENIQMIGRTISHYRIVEKLGEGGMGVVYVAEDTVLGRRVAIKTLTARGGGNQHFRARFLREARAVSALSHPHIATIYDYGETDDRDPYIVMELIKGETLSEMMLKEALTIPRSIEIIKQVAEALGEAHHHGIVHRDIKPSNVAINEHGNVKVLDFGLAKQIQLANGTDIADSPITQTREGVIVGTPLYLSPEQALGIDIDARSDLFTLGSLLYECIAGKPAFSGGSPVEIGAQIIREDPPPPSLFNPDVPEELDGIVKRALAKKPEERYQTAEQIIGDLETAHSRILGLDRTVTRMTVPTNGTQRSGTLATLSDIFRRPRLSIGYVAGGLVLLTLVSAGAWRIMRKGPYQPNAEAQRLYDLGTDAFRAGLSFQASKALEQAIKKDDEFALAHARLAEAWLDLDYVDKAKDEMLRVSQLTPDRSSLPPVDSFYLDAVTASVRGDFARAIQAYSELARLQPRQSSVYVDLGRAYEKNNQIAKAIDSYNQAASLDQQNPTAFLRLGILNGRQHQIQDANAAFDRAEVIYQTLGNVEGRTEVTFQRGVLLNDIAGRVEEARIQLVTALEMAKVVNNQYQQIRILFQLSSVLFKLGKTDQAQEYARQAVAMAEANTMESLIARGFIDLGYTYLVRGDYANAERNFEEGLHFAQRFGARQNEARAQLSLASLYMQRGDVDRTLAFSEQALNFYQTGGYRTQTAQALLLRGRAFQFKGDYLSAQQSFEQQLTISEESNDQAQIAYSHANLGYLLLDAEKYSEALRHFDESYSRNKALNNQLYIGYDLLNRGATLWRMGQFEAANLALEQATAIAKTDGTNFKELQAFINLIEAQMLLAEQKFAASTLKCNQAIELAGVQNQISLVRAKYQLGLAVTLSGDPQQGEKTCQQAYQIATSLGDPLLTARAQLALAEAGLAAHSFGAALENATEAQAFFARTGLVEAEWRACLIAGVASERAGDANEARTEFQRASELLSSLQQKWGSEVFEKYINRRDIRSYRQQLGRSNSAGTHT